jgi:hypothetical protein
MAGRLAARRGTAFLILDCRSVTDREHVELFRDENPSFLFQPRKVGTERRVDPEVNRSDFSHHPSPLPSAGAEGSGAGRRLSRDAFSLHRFEQ